MPTTIVLYLTHRFQWSATRVGLTLTVVGVALIVVQVGVVGRVVKQLGDRYAMILGLLCGAAGMAIAAFAPQSWVIWAGIPVLALWGVAGAATQTLMTRHVEPSEQGQLQGANASLTGLSELIGPTVFSLGVRLFRAAPNAYRGFWSAVLSGRPDPTLRDGLGLVVHPHRSAGSHRVALALLSAPQVAVSPSPA